MTISSAMNVLIKFVISITFSFAFSFSENDDMHPVNQHYYFPTIWVMSIRGGKGLATGDAVLDVILSATEFDCMIVEWEEGVLEHVGGILVRCCRRRGCGCTLAPDAGSSAGKCIRASVQ